MDYFKQKNILFWCGDIADTEAFQISGILSASRYPFVALVAPQGTKMQVVDRFQGITSNLFNTSDIIYRKVYRSRTLRST